MVIHILHTLSIISEVLAICNILKVDWSWKLLQSVTKLNIIV